MKKDNYLRSPKENRTFSKVINFPTFVLSSPKTKRVQVALVVKNLSTNSGDARDMGYIPGPKRFPGVGNGNPLQYSCQENLMDRGAWRATVHGVTKSQTRLSD